MSNEADFLIPTHENTLTWGDTQTLNINPGDSGSVTTRQLLHVHRRRPTSFTICVTVNLLKGWTGLGSNITFTLLLALGVGQAKTVFQKAYTVAAASVIDGTQVVSDLFTVPATAMNAQMTFAPLGALGAGEHSVTLTILAAPVYS